MVKKKNDIIQISIIVVLILAVVGILFYMIPYRYKLNSVKTYDLDPNYIDNPLMGFAPSAEEIQQCENSNLVYIEITWAEWEPEKGIYNIKGIENKFNIERWKSKNKKAVLRFVCDIPGEDMHMDIPEWLYNLTNDGEEYSNDYGMGYSPNYENETFINYHEKAIEALASYCNKDSFVVFVELGSIGHWGEWHANNGMASNLMPDKDVCEIYANHYSDNFVNAILLTRRNYDFAVEGDFGFYNDMTGDDADTREWLEWLENGNVQKTSGEALNLSPVSKLGMTTPVGGEFTSGITMDELLGSKFGDVLSLISSTHMTFIGPNVPDLTDVEIETARQSILRRMGYRIYISKLETQYEFGNNILNVTTYWKNSGNAGFYFDWPVTMYVYDKNMNIIYSQALEIDLRGLNSGMEKMVCAQIPYSDDIKDEFYIGIKITDYEGNDGLKLAIKMEEELGVQDGCQLIYHYKR